MRRGMAAFLLTATVLAGLTQEAFAAASSTELGLQQLVLHDGNRLAYRKYEPRGDAQLAPIIVLHGGPGVPPLKASFDFYGRLAALGHAVYVYEQIGVGQSSRLDDVSGYTLQRNVDDLEELRAEIQAPRIILIGQSWGAVLATYYLARHPDAVERAILVSPGAFRRGDRFSNDYGRTASTGVHAPLELMVAGWLARVNVQLALRFADQAELGRAYDAFWADPASVDAFNCRGYQPHPAHLERDRGANYAVLLMTAADLDRAPDPAPALRAAEAPVLVLRGECDFIPRSVAEDYTAALPNARIVDIPGAGHAAPDAKPAEVLAILRVFLAGG